MPHIFRTLCVLASLAFAGAASAQSLTRPCSSTLPDVTIPPDAVHPVEVIQPEYQPPQRMANLGFDHVVATVNVVTTYPCSRGIGSMVEIQYLHLIRYDPLTRVRTIEQTVRAGTANTLVGGTWYREPVWFQGGQPDPQPWLTWNNNGNFAVSVESAPLGVYHWWSHPRIRMLAGYPYFIEARIRVIGDTRVQLGLDYWRGAATVYNGYSDGCVNSNNCEAYQGPWIGPTNGKFVTVTTPMTLYTY